jgi:hypothetical protein
MVAPKSIAFENQRLRERFSIDGLFHYTKPYTPINRRCLLS